MKKSLKIVFLFAICALWSSCNPQVPNNPTLWGTETKEVTEMTDCDSLLMESDWLSQLTSVEQQTPVSQSSRQERVKLYRKQARVLRWRAMFGNAEAQLGLASCYLSGKGVKQDIHKALKWYKRAARKGLAEAQCMVGLSYWYTDKHQAFSWLQKAADQNLDEAMLCLGYLYDINGNNEEADKWYTKFWDPDPERIRTEFVYHDEDVMLNAYQGALAQKPKQKQNSPLKLFLLKGLIACGILAVLRGIFK